MNKRKKDGEWVEREMQCTLLDARRGARINAETLKNKRTSLNVISVADNLHQLTETSIHNLKHLGKPAPFACKEGCAWCCYAIVEVTPPELFRIKKHVDQHFSPEETTALRERLQNRFEVMKPLTKEKRVEAMVPCPLLVNNRCSVHPSRPVRCRGCHSYSAEECEASFKVKNSIPILRYVSVILACGIIEDQTKEGLRLAELSNDTVDLGEGLRFIFENPDAESKWLSGEKVFDTIRW